LHSISEYCIILNTPHHLCRYWNWLNTLPSSSILSVFLDCLYFWLPLRYSLTFIYLWTLTAVPDLDKERSWANPPVRPLPIPHLHDWRQMEVCLKFWNILKSRKWSAEKGLSLSKSGTDNATKWTGTSNGATIVSLMQRRTGKTSHKLRERFGFFLFVFCCLFVVYCVVVC
jgi:hypothetical protein